MKKIKLNLSALPGAEILTREQLKKVVGGMYSGDDDGRRCKPTECEAKSSPALGTCVCTAGDQCVCVS